MYLSASPRHPSWSTSPPLAHATPSYSRASPAPLATTIDDGSLGFSGGEEKEEVVEEEEKGGRGMGRGEYPISSPLTEERKRSGQGAWRDSQFSILAMMAAVLRRSLVVCSVDPAEVEEDLACSSAFEIGWPTDVRHVAHVTFDRIDGFLGLPEELEPDVPRNAPSASSEVFGVSANLMQCICDERGNCVPTILLLMQRHIYRHGGLQTEGIFRINGENGHEHYVREQLNKGIIPQGVDLHCLASLVKAWFRELPSGVLDPLRSDQIMHCNAEEECSRLVSLLPPTEAALLDWVINLMADVVQHECYTKMNARSISMVFAPNMTQMADPLTALVYAVQVMNFLRTLVVKVLRERNERITHLSLIESCSQHTTGSEDRNLLDDDMGQLQGWRTDRGSDSFNSDQFCSGNLISPHQERSHSYLGEEIFSRCWKMGEADAVSSDETAASGINDPVPAKRCINADRGLVGRFRLRGTRKLRGHPIFQLSRLVRKSGDLKEKSETVAC